MYGYGYDEEKAVISAKIYYLNPFPITLIKPQFSNECLPHRKPTHPQN